jgi:hypothetical protein
MWDHYTTINNEGRLVKAQCKYYDSQIAAHPVHHGTSGLRKHFNVVGVILILSLHKVFVNK